MNRPILREVTASEDRALAVLCAITFKEAYEGVHTPENLDAYCATNYTPSKLALLLSSAETHCKIASRNGVDVGYTLLVRHPCPVPLDGGSIELKQIYVRRSEYGSGLARLMLDDALETTRTLSARYLWLAVADNNTRAQAFYRKLAFQPVGAGPVFFVGTDRLTSTLLARAV